MVKLDTAIHLDFEKFWHWWKAELEFLVPESLRNLISHKQKFLVVKKKDEELELTYIADGSHRKLGVFSMDADGQQAVDRLFSEQKVLTEGDIILRLSPAQGLRKIFKLPVAAQQNLKNVVAFEMDRQTPFNVDKVYYDARQVDKLPNTNQIQVELVLVLRTKLDELLQEISAWGIRPTLVDMAQIDGNPDLSKPNYNLLTESLRRKKRDIPKILNISLTIMLSLLFIGMLIIPIGSKKAYLTELQQEVSKVSKVATEVQSLKKEVDDQLRELGFLLEKKRSKPVMVETLEELTKLIPDNAWLTTLQYKNGRLQIQGYSPAASTLIEIIESSPIFRNTRFVSPVTQDQKTQLERFQIATEIINRRVSEQTADQKS